ncbi:CHAT domain-containing protein [bacterium]|nr:CHAT domain-containing protein [candidate division CSSED10-310 bacterium]
MKNRLKRLLNMPSMIIRYQIMKDYPELVSKNALNILNSGKEENQSKKDYQSIQILSKESLFIESCLLNGISRVCFGWSDDQGIRLNTCISEEFKNNLVEFSRLQKYPSSDEAVILIKELLNSTDNISFPHLWGELNVLLGNAYYLNRKTNPSDVIELAVEYFKTAMTVFDQESFPAIWGRIQYLLGSACFYRIIGNRIENLERALEHCLKALRIFTAEIHPYEWALTYHLMGNIYSERIIGEHSENKEKGIECFRKALTVFQKDSFPLDWALVQTDMALTYTERVEGNRSDNIEQSLHHFREALAIRTREAFPDEWGMTMNNMGINYNDRIRGDRSENQEMAIDYLNQALSVRSKRHSPREWANTMTNLGIVYNQRIWGDRSANLEQALHYCHSALEVIDAKTSPHAWASIHLNLGGSYINRVMGNREHNLEKAVCHFRKAFRVFKRSAVPYLWSIIHANLGHINNILIADLGKDTADKAIYHFKASLNERSRKAFPADWAIAQVNMAYAFFKRHRGNPKINEKRAIGLLNNGLEIFDLYTFPRDRIDTLDILAKIHMSRNRWNDAFACFEEMRSADEMLHQSEFLHISHEHRYQLTSRLYSEASYCLSRMNRIPESLEWLENGKIRVLRDRMQRNRAMFHQLPSEDKAEYLILEQKLKELESEQRNMSLDTAEYLKMAENARKTRSELTMLVTRIRCYMPDFLHQGIRYETIRQCLSEKNDLVAVVYNVTCRGTAITLISGTPQNTCLRTYLSADFTDEALKQLTDMWFSANERFQSSPEAISSRLAWGNAIIECMEEAYRKLYKPVADIISHLHPDIIVFIPNKSLHVLPLHLMNYVKNGGRRYLMDDYEIRYTPSFELICSKSMETDRQPIQSMIGVSDPTGTLKWSQEEVTGISNYLSQVSILTGRQAIIPEVMKRAVDADVLHISTHGIFDIRNPYQSSLLFSISDRESTVINTPENDDTSSVDMPVSRIRHLKSGRRITVDITTNRPEGELWTLDSILKNLNLVKTRLVVLSACESGIVSIERLPDEYIGLPSGFLAAGARTVVCSLWKVDDESTCELMKQFYNNLLTKGQSTAAALRNAQLTVRSLSKFENPFFWGAFQVSGI